MRDIKKPKATSSPIDSVPPMVRLTTKPAVK